MSSILCVAGLAEFGQQDTLVEQSECLGAALLQTMQKTVQDPVAAVEVKDDEPHAELVRGLMGEMKRSYLDLTASLREAKLELQRIGEDFQLVSMLGIRNSDTNQTFVRRGLGH